MNFIYWLLIALFNVIIYIVIPLAVFCFTVIGIYKLFLYLNILSQ